MRLYLTNGKQKGSEKMGHLFHQFRGVFIAVIIAIIILVMALAVGAWFKSNTTKQLNSFDAIIDEQMQEVNAYKETGE